MGRRNRKEESPRGPAAETDEEERFGPSGPEAPGGRRADSDGDGAGAAASGDEVGWLLALRPPGGVRLLLLAKDSPFRRLLGEALASRGHQVTVASDSHEAMAHGQRARFDVALVLLPAAGTPQLPQLLMRLRDLDPDLEVVWAPPPQSVGQIEGLIEAAAARAGQRLEGLLTAARGLLEPQRPEETAARLLEQAEAVLAAQATLRAPEPWEPQHTLLSPDRRRLRVPLWENGPMPEEDGAEDSGHRLELSRAEEGPELSRADLLRAAVLGSLGSLALTRAHCEVALAELYRELDHARQKARPLDAQEAQAVGLTSGSLGPLERLAGVLAHELNNPLTFVLANLTCLQEDLDGLRKELAQAPGAAAALSRCDELREVLGEAIGGAGRVREVVADLTTLGTRDSGEGVQPVAIDEVVRAALRIARREVQRRAQVTVDLEPRLPRVVGSQSRLGQVLLNLLLNAVQAVPAGEAEAHEVRIEARAEGEQVLIRISDTGAGIPPERLGRVFEPGYTTKTGKTGAPGEGEGPGAAKGSGLGLAISREIVRTHGGDIRIDSQPGAGTTVTVLLPAFGRASQGDLA